jgi:hypothetical protein
MWWPAIGGVVIGLGGLIFPRALGTGYDVIASLIGGNTTWQLIAGVLIIKSIIWAFSLGSGTSGGILAPLLMIGGALGALIGHGLPFVQVGAWPLVGMAAILAGAIGCPLTAAVLSMELTHNYGLMLPLLAASVAAHAFTVLFQKRSILTERLSRRGYHLSREYGVDPLETVMVSHVMRMNGDPVRETVAPSGAGTETLVVYPGETLRVVAERMANGHVTDMQVVDPNTGKQVGSVSLQDMLHARVRSYNRETNQVRVRRLRMPFAKARIKEAEQSLEPMP